LSIQATGDVLDQEQGVASGPFHTAAQFGTRVARQAQAVLNVAVRDKLPRVRAGNDLHRPAIGSTKTMIDGAGTNMGA
jgi:hypothetical protein